MNEQPNPMRGWPWVVAVVLIVGLAVGLPRGEPSAAEAARESRRDLMRDIEVQCELAVQRRLVSPSTMRTNPVKDPRATTEGLYEYGLVIDSQNSFGAMIRSVWRCMYHPMDGVVRVTQLE